MSGALPQPVEVIDPVVLMRIRQEYRPGMSAQALYEATRGVWVMGRRRALAKYAVSVYDGVVQEIYAIEGWHPAGTTDYLVRLDHEVSVPGRWEFTGKPAAEFVRDR